jgi:ERF superfamily protein
MPQNDDAKERRRSRAGGASNLGGMAPSVYPEAPMSIVNLNAEKALAPMSGTPFEAALLAAVQAGPETVERIVALINAQEDRAAAREFSRARAEFQAECPVVPKSSMAKIATKSGTTFSYAYAELDEIAQTVGPYLHKHGFSYSWSAEFKDGNVACVCTLSHSAGHSESAPFSAPTDAASAMSGPQRNAAALTYAKRQSLLMALGISTGEPSDDAMEGSTETIDASQMANLDALIEEVKADRGKFLAYLGVKTLAEIRASDFQRAVAALEAKRKKGAS